jgi:hypothetical protein
MEIARYGCRLSALAQYAVIFHHAGNSKFGIYKCRYGFNLMRTMMHLDAWSWITGNSRSEELRTISCSLDLEMVSALASTARATSIFVMAAFRRVLGGA